MSAAVSATQMTRTRDRPWLKTAPTASGRRWPVRRAVRIWTPSARPSGKTRKSKSTESATAMAPSSVTPTRARKMESIRWRRVSLASARMMGSETLQTSRERLSVVITTQVRLGLFGLDANPPHAVSAIL